VVTDKVDHPEPLLSFRAAETTTELLEELEGEISPVQK
jgi:hypothetical protein